MNTPRTQGSRWLAPDIAMMAALATLYYCLVPGRADWRFFSDSDTGWHIRTGDWIRTHLAVPHTDPFSFLHPDRPWFAWEWGADVLMSLVHAAGGPAGVTALYAIAIALTAWLWFRWNRRLGGNLVFACLLAAPLISSTQVHWLARPHVLSWVLLLSSLFLLERIGERFTWREAAALAGGTALWAALHASFFLCGEIAALYALAWWVKPIFWKDIDRAAAHAKALRYLQAGAIIGLSSLVNPYGWNLHLHVLEFLRHPEWREAVNEWRPLDWSRDGTAQLALALAVVLVGAWFALRERRLEHALVMAVLTVSALGSARGIPLVALVCLPMANGAFTAWLRGGQRARGLFATTDEFDALDRQHHGGALAAVALIAVAFWIQMPRDDAGFSPDRFPTGAAAAISQLPYDARILASDVVGGFLIYRFYPQRRIYYDGRVDYFGVEPGQRLTRIVTARAGWKQDLAEAGFTHALVESRWPVAPLLEGEGWKRLWSDERYLLLGRP